VSRWRLKEYFIRFLGKLNDPTKTTQAKLRTLTSVPSARQQLKKQNKKWFSVSNRKEGMGRIERKHYEGLKQKDKAAGEALTARKLVGQFA
jgi:hypothetical protein